MAEIRSMFMFFLLGLLYPGQWSPDQRSFKRTKTPKIVAYLWGKYPIWGYHIQLLNELVLMFFLEVGINGGGYMVKLHRYGFRFTAQA